MDDPTRLSQIMQANWSLWCFCLECGHGMLLDPAHLAARVKADELDAVAKRLKCTRCNGRHSKLVPTRRFRKP